MEARWDGGERGRGSPVRKPPVEELDRLRSAMVCPTDSSLEVAATTGMLEGDGAFAPHGHVVRLSLRAA